jgi:AcrR family transcriptional regulator
MVENQIIEKRSRGRPQLRCDDDTKSLIIEAAGEQFRENGFAAASISAIAQSAGVSTKTLYRLFPAKADLFFSVISDRTSRFYIALDESTLATMGLREGLERLLTAYGMLTLSEETIAMTRLVVAESDRFPEIATAFYRTAIMGTNTVMERWLKTQHDRGMISLSDPHMAIGMLRGMMIMEPQRAAMLRQLAPPDIKEIGERAKMCARLFLDGCKKQP